MSADDATPAIGEGERRRAYGALAGAALVALPIVHGLARAPAAAQAAVAACLALALALGLLAALEGRASRGVDHARTVLSVLAAACTAPLGWVFGPNAGFEAVVSLLVLLAGLFSRAERPHRSVLVYATLAGGQLGVLVLVLALALPDESLAPVLVPGHPLWHHLLAHFATQGVDLAAFLAGRALRARYAEVTGEIARTVRATAIKKLLVEEAREDYRRVLRAVRRAQPLADGTALAHAEGAASAASPPPPSAAGASPEAPAPAPRPEERGASTTQRARALWMDAYRTRMTGQVRFVLALCLAGGGVLAAIGREPAPRAVGLIAIGAILVVTMSSRTRGRDERASYASWTLVAILSVGPAYAFGLHSAFASVIAALLFVGAAFGAGPGAARVARRLPVWLGVALAHGALFAAIATGLVPDEGNLAVLVPGHPWHEALALHAMLQAAYLAAFASGLALDARFEQLTRRAATAEAQLAGSEAELSRTDRDIARALAGEPSDLFTGETLGRYRVGPRIASGAMGDVYAASRDDGLAVAIKLVRRERVGEAWALELFAREARALARVQSPAVARIHESGVDRDVPYVVMERIEGRSLAAELRTRGALDRDELRVLVRDLCRGVRDIHDAGLVHRDLKPQNVLRASEGAPESDCRWKIVDFGLALHGAEGRETTGGTAGYVAPEQALGERVDTRADLYSLGLVIYRALTGRPAFVGADAVAIALRARQSGPPDPKRNVEVPRELELVLRIALAARPEGRFATARELGAALAAALEGRISDAHRARGERLLESAPWSAPP